jgi:putative phosphoesterase
MARPAPGRIGGVRAVILSDTHVPRRARDLPPDLWAAIDDADVVIHAGDWVAASLVTALASRARLIGVYGNNDGPDVRAVLPEVAYDILGGVRVAVVHETGAAAGRERRMDAAYDADLLVFGHSHIPWDTVTPGGMRLLNPGSPTDRRRQPYGTWVSATFGGGVVDISWHRVPRPQAAG